MNEVRRVCVGRDSQFFREVRRFEQETGGIVVHGHPRKPLPPEEPELRAAE